MEDLKVLRKEQTQLARDEVLRQVPPLFRAFFLLKLVLALRTSYMLGQHSQRICLSTDLRKFFRVVGLETPGR